ncbi:hypothetical protein [Anaerovorax odorimutans]|uniref:hypothetical protein n=1 Tax=Anaerovorax odorimutans TaxID=109327 RepID=UPI00041E0D90|nr:hypothetical protein [Anaerovorax odorimutans]
MKKGKLRVVVFLLFVSMLFTFSGCQSNEKIIMADMNKTEILNTEKVVKILNNNGMNLSKDNNFPIDLSLCKVYGKKPQPYLSSQTGAYYIFYEYDGYSETSILAKDAIFYEYPGCSDDFKKNIYPSNIVGKNIYVCLWYPDLDSWSDSSMSEEDNERFDLSIQEMIKLRQELNDKVFNKKKAVLTGYGNNWFVKIPVEFIYNQNHLLDKVFLLNAQILLKPINFEETPEVKSIKLVKNINDYSLMSTDGNFLRNKNEEGFYTTFWINETDFDPNNMELKVTITCEDSKTGEILCKVRHEEGNNYIKNDKLKMLFKEYFL